MSKLKELREKRATVYTAIDELRKSADGREMTAEEQTRWDTLLSDYEKAESSRRSDSKKWNAAKQNRPTRVATNHKAKRIRTNPPTRSTAPLLWST